MKSTKINLACRLASVLFFVSFFSVVAHAAPMVESSDSSAVQDVIVNDFSGVNLTVVLKEVTEVDAGFSGKVVKGENFSANSFGIVYSTEPSFTASSASTIPIVDIYGDNYYSVTAEYLKPSTTYYYTSYIKQYGLYKYGEIKSFTTSSVAVPVLDAVSGITEVSADISGQLLPMSRPASDVEYGVQYSVVEDFSAEVSRKVISNHRFRLSISSLLPSTTYYYRPYVKVNGGYEYGDAKSFTTVGLVAPELNAVSDVTEVSARVAGKVVLASGLSDDMQYGVQISALNDFSQSSYSVVDRIDSECVFRLMVSSLLPSTTYYYRPYVRMNGVYGYGDVKSFTTAGLVAPFLDPMSQITDASAMVSGQVFLASGVSDDMKYGVQISSSASFKTGVYDMKVTDIDADCRFGMQASSLMPYTTYYYRPYIRMNDVYCYGTIKTFTTPAPDMSKVMDLSSAGTANCYIVSELGRYAFKLVKGNSKTSVGSVADVSVLWESFGTSYAPDKGDLISDLYLYKDYVVFDVENHDCDCDEFWEGNALVAATDASGQILWSWHIWFTDEPQEQEYYNGAGIMMDRNLGATSATPGYVVALGLMYQWGRKDPFMGSCSIDSNYDAEATISWPSAVTSNSSIGTIEYATSHPTTFITYNSYNNDWYYTGSSRIDNTRWTTSDKAKSIYDPCPPGWRVPDGGSNGVWSKANDSSSSFNRYYDTYDEGMNFSGQFGNASTIWYPASGFRSPSSGKLSSVGKENGYWSASSTCGFRFFCDGSVQPHVEKFHQADGFPVRCIKE